MQISEGTAIFIRSNGDVQVGLGRQSTTLTGLSPGEQSYIHSLKFQSSNTASQTRARKRKIPSERINEIYSLLKNESLVQLGVEAESTPDSKRLMRRDGNTSALVKRSQVRVDIVAHNCGDPTQFLQMKPFISVLVQALRGASIRRVDLKYLGSDMGATSRLNVNAAVGLGRPISWDPHFVVALFTRASSYSLVKQWQDAGVPLLSVVFNEDNIQIGPVVRTGGSPCLECVDRNLKDIDQEWPALQIQCRDQPFPRLSPDLTSACAMMTARLIANEIDGFGLPDGEVRFVDEDFLVSRFRWPTHPECGCVTLPHSVTMPPAGE